MTKQTGKLTHTLMDEWEHMGERIHLSPEVASQLMLREHAARYGAIGSISLASFVRGVRQV